MQGWQLREFKRMIEEAGVAQTAEHLNRNQGVAGSMPVASSRLDLARQMVIPCALVAQSAERLHGKQEVESSILSMGPDFEQVSRCCK